MITFHLAATSNDTNPAGIAIPKKGLRSGVYQVDITGGTATVTLQGRLGSAFAWQTILTVTTSTIAEVIVAPEMRETITSLSGATINSGLGF